MSFNDKNGYFYLELESKESPKVNYVLSNDMPKYISNFMKFKELSYSFNELLSFDSKNPKTKHFMEVSIESIPVSKEEYISSWAEFLKSFYGVSDLSEIKDKKKLNNDNHELFINFDKCYLTAQKGFNNIKNVHAGKKLDRLENKYKQVIAPFSICRPNFNDKLADMNEIIKNREKQVFGVIRYLADVLGLELKKSGYDNSFQSMFTESSDKESIEAIQRVFGIFLEDILFFLDFVKNEKRFYEKYDIKNPEKQPQRIINPSLNNKNRDLSTSRQGSLSVHLSKNENIEIKEESRYFDPSLIKGNKGSLV